MIPRDTAGVRKHFHLWRIACVSLLASLLLFCRCDKIPWQKQFEDRSSYCGFWDFDKIFLSQLSQEYRSEKKKSDLKLCLNVKSGATWMLSLQGVQDRHECHAWSPGLIQDWCHSTWKKCCPSPSSSLCLYWTTMRYPSCDTPYVTLLIWHPSAFIGFQKRLPLLWRSRSDLESSWPVWLVLCYG